MQGKIGNLTDADRLKRVLTIDKLIEDGLNTTEITKELGISRQAVSNAKKYMLELKKADLTGKDIAEKRAETYVKLIEAEQEAKTLFEMYKTPMQCPECQGVGRIDVKRIIDDKETIVKIVCTNCKGLGALHQPKDAERFHIRWVETIKNIADLYGLNSIKAESFIQINAQKNTYVAPAINLNDKAQKILRDSIIDAHESNVRQLT